MTPYTTAAGVPFHVYQPYDDHAQSSIEGRIYFDKANAIVQRRDGAWAVFVRGLYHSQHDTPMGADLALRSAVDGD